MLTNGSPLPALHVTDTDGRAMRLGAGSGPTLLYFMRSASCAICNAHVRDLAGRADEFEAAGVRVIVAMPETRDAAAAWKAKREVPFVVVTGSEGTPHAALGLSRKLFGTMQQSGTVLVDAQGIVRHAQVATMPLQAYDQKAIASAVAALAPVAVA